MTEKLTDAELEFLTEEERAALMGDEAEDTVENDAEDGADDDGDAESDAGTPETDATGERPDPGAKADDDVEADEPKVAPLVPLIKGEAVADATAKLDEIKTRRADLAQKFDDGELSAREYSTHLEALDEERDALREAIFKDKLAKEMAEQQSQQVWEASVKDFIGDHPEIARNELTWSSFDTVVRKVTADPANSRLSYAKQLQKAHDLWTDQLGIKSVRPVTGQADTKLAKTERKVPITLAKVPAATVNDTDDGKYAALDRLAESDPDAYEARLSRMSQTEIDEYERVSA